MTQQTTVKDLAEQAQQCLGRAAVYRVLVGIGRTRYLPRDAGEPQKLIATGGTLVPTAVIEEALSILEQMALDEENDALTTLETPL